MDSYQLLSSSHSDHHQQVQNCSSSAASSLCSEMQRGCSKAQNCLFKILRIISTVPPHNNSSKKLNGCNGFAVDLNIEFNVPSEKTVEEESESPVDGRQSTCTADEKCPVAAECGGVDFEKCSDDGGEETPCKSDTSVVQLVGVCEANKSEEKIGEELKEEKGFMGLLIEAATLIFGDFKEENPKSEYEMENKICKSESTIEKLKLEEQHNHDVAATKKQLKRRNDDCTEEGKSSYPLVRSKRGRIQVLPNKYKDSILEPLTPLSRIRSTIVPNRRRSK